MAAPLAHPVSLRSDPALRANYFTERRELGALNIGGSGSIQVDGKTYVLENLDCLYIGRGNAEISFTSNDPGSPAIFYLLSYPAHAAYPTKLVRKAEAIPTELAVRRHATTARYVSTSFSTEPGAASWSWELPTLNRSVWNTMQAHTHMRRSEISMYFNVADDARVFHMIGPADETRHIVMKNREVAISRLVDPFRRGHARLQLLLGNGRRESGLRGHGSRSDRKPALN